MKPLGKATLVLWGTSNFPIEDFFDAVDVLFRELIHNTPDCCATMTLDSKGVLQNPLSDPDFTDEDKADFEEFFQRREKNEEDSCSKN
jgi:hypothetical protein